MNVRNFPKGSGQRRAANVLLGVLCTIAVIGAVLVAYLRLTINQRHLAARSQVWNACMPVAEAGVEEALAHCNANYSTNMASNGWLPVGGLYVKSNWVGNSFYVTRISQTQPYVILSSGYSPLPRGSSYLVRTVRVTTKPLGYFKGALIVRNTISLDGNNVTTDSYDSRDPLKSTMSRYDPLKKGDKGDVACMSGLIDAFNAGNANIWGHVYTGADANLAQGPNASVGSLKWHSDGRTGVEDGWWVKDLNIVFPEVAAPFTSGSTPASKVTVNGVQYDYVLGSGNYAMPSLGKKVVVTGRAVLYVNNEINFSSSDVLEILPGASLTVYMAGQSAVFNTIVNHNARAENFVYYGLPSNTSLKLNGKNGVTGAFYAPDADIFFVGESTMYGAVAGKRAKLNGNSALHYDEALEGLTPPGYVRVASWDEI